MHNYSVSLSTNCLKNPPLLINTQHYSSRSQYGGRRWISRLSSILQATHPQQTLTFRRIGVGGFSDPPDSVTPGHCVLGLSDPPVTES